MIAINKDIIQHTINNTTISKEVIKELIDGLFIPTNTNDQYKLRLEYRAIFECVASVSQRNPKLRNALIQKLKRKSRARNNPSKIDRACLAFESIIFPEGIHLYSMDDNKRHVGDKNQKDQYQYIPCNITSFIRGVLSTKDFLKGKKFVDVGCGIGDKVFVTDFLSSKMECSGIEYDTTTHSVAQEKSFIYGRGLRFKRADAFSVDFSEYDRIYTYQPLHNETKLLKLYKHIAKTMPKGGMWFEASSLIWENFIRDSKKFEVVSSSKSFGYARTLVARKVRQ